MVNKFEKMMNESSRDSGMKVLGEDRARKLFTQVAEAHSEASGVKQLNEDAFVGLVMTLIKAANDDAAVMGHASVSVPSKRALSMMFKQADADESGTIEEEEFVRIFKLAVEGKVKGIKKRGGFKWYSKPTQIRQWGDHEAHPDTDWQDLFFDLLFVGGAYQIGNLYASSIYDSENTLRDKHMGFWWFMVLFMCVAQSWFMKLQLASRYWFRSFFHSYVVETVEFTIIAFMIWNVPGANFTVHTIEEDSSYSSYGSPPSGPSRRLASGYYGESFSPIDQLETNVQYQTRAFSICVALHNLLLVLKWAEVYRIPDPTSGSKTISKYMMMSHTLVGIVFSVGAIVASMHSDDEEHADRGNKYTILIWGAGLATYVLLLLCWAQFLNTRKDPRESTVPTCVNYIIHRIGEWTMLMIGETVLSLLTVPLLHKWRQHLIFGGGMVIAAQLGFQHYATYPSNPDNHVLRQSRLTLDGVAYEVLMVYAYSGALILVGVGSKVLLKMQAYNNPDGEIHLAANWSVAGGLTSATLLLRIFQFLHTEERLLKIVKDHFRDSKNIRKIFFDAILVIWSAVMFLLIGYLELRPFKTMVYSCAVAVAESMLMVANYTRSGSVKSDTGHDHVAHEYGNHHDEDEDDGSDTAKDKADTMNAAINMLFIEDILNADELEDMKSRISQKNPPSPPSPPLPPGKNKVSPEL